MTSSRREILKPMGDRRSWMTGLWCALALLTPVGAVAAEGDQLLATVDKPAIVTAAPAATTTPGREGAAQPRVVITVNGFQPATDGEVQAVVRVQKPDGTEQEVGRFAPFPQAEFRAGTSGGQRFTVPLPKELAGGGPVKFKVELRPIRAGGQGARLEVGGAEID